MADRRTVNPQERPVWPWAKTTQTIRTLAEWWHARQGFMSVEHGKRPRQRWSMVGVREEQVERLAALASSARRLDALMRQPGWKDLLEAKLYYQSLADRRTKNPDASEQERFRAACEWSSLEGFVMELHARVRRGQEAEEKVRQVVAQRSPGAATS